MKIHRSNQLFTNSKGFGTAYTQSQLNLFKVSVRGVRTNQQERANKDSTDDKESDSVAEIANETKPSRGKRFKMWSKKLRINTLEFIKDCLRFDKEKVTAKCSNFGRRNYVRVRRTSAHLWDEAKKIGYGFVNLKDDIKTSVLDVKQTHYSRYQKPSYTYSNKIQRVTKDVIKFIPFSIFILIPGLELLLPAWLIIFPNATPSQFQSKATGQKKMETLIKNRDQGAKRLLYKLPKFLHLLLENPHLTKEEREEVNELVKLVESDKVMYTELLHYKHLFYKYCDFKHFKTTTLIDMAHFMGLNPVTGLNTINNLLSLFRVSIQIDNKFVSWFTKIILRRELRLFFNKIRREDSYLFWEQVESLDEKAFDSILIERGIDFHNQDYDSKLKDYKMWQSII